MAAEFAAERFRQVGGRGGWFDEGGGKIHFDPVAEFIADEGTAFCMEAGFRVGREATQFPEDVGAGEGGMAAERDFDGGGEPAELEGAMIGWVRGEKSRLGQIHFHGDGCHPFFLAWGVEDADRRGISVERRGSERIDLSDLHWHL